MISNTNHKEASLIGLTERKVLETIQANCNSPIGVYAFINDNNSLTIKTELFSHDGEEKFTAEISGELEESINLGYKVGNMIIDQVGLDYIKELDNLKNDFNYTP